MLAYVLRGIIFFFAVVSLAAVSAKEENLTPEEELDLMENGETVNEDENPSLDNAVDLQEGQIFWFFPETMKDVHNLTLNQNEEKHKEIKIGVLRDTITTTTLSA